MKRKHYVMLVENPKTKEKKRYTSTTQGSAPAGWVCVAVLGYFEKDATRCAEYK